MKVTPSAREVHLVGSVPLSCAEEVFRETSAILGSRLRKIPDGETGDRTNWINFQYGVLARSPALDFDGPAIDLDALARERDGEGSDYQFTKLKLREGASANDVVLGELGYARHALESYARFSAMKQAGQVAADARFQLSLPTPLAPVAVFVTPRNLFDVYPVYAAALRRELEQVLAAVPPDELAVQWDVAVEIGLWEGVFPRPPGDWKAMLLGQISQLGGLVPEPVQLGYHLCYGDRGHQHFVEPKDTAVLVEVANGISERVGRTIQWIHLPVPRDRDDDAYFAPLAGLRLHPETTLFLGLVHHTDGVEGTRRRVAAASRVISDFGIGTECGMGRRNPATILDLLRVHAEI